MDKQDTYLTKSHQSHPNESGGNFSHPGSRFYASTSFEETTSRSKPHSDGKRDASLPIPNAGELERARDSCQALGPWWTRRVRAVNLLLLLSSARDVCLEWRGAVKHS